MGELRGSMVDQLALRNAAVEQHMGGCGPSCRGGELVGLQRERAEQQGRVETRLSEMAAVSARLVDTTQSLRQALANPRRGQWGERMADDVLRAAGLVEGISYRKQSATSAGTVPDFTFMLPGDRVLHMDVKFPVDNYLRYLEATSERERDQHAIAFVRDVRAGRASCRAAPTSTPTAPSTRCCSSPTRRSTFAHQHDRDLLDVALQQKAVLAQHAFSVLAVIRQAVEQTRLQRTSDEILACRPRARAAVEQVLRCARQGGAQPRHRAPQLGRPVGHLRRQLERELDRGASPHLAQSPAATAGPVTRRTSRSRPATRASPATPRRGAGRRARSFRCPGRRRRQRADQRRSGWSESLWRPSRSDRGGGEGSSPWRRAR